MNEPLHPLSLSEILDKTAQLYRSRFLVFAGIGIIPAGTVFGLAAGIFVFIAWMGASAKNGAAVADVLIWVFLGVLCMLIIPVGLGANAVGQAAMTEASARLFLGETISIRSAYKTAWHRGWRYIGLYTLQGIIVFGPPAVLFCLAVFGMIFARVRGSAANDDSPLFGGLVLLLLLGVGAFAVWILLRLCLAFPVSVVEQATAVDALRRGTLLSHGTRSRIFLLYVLGVILNQILAWCVTFPALIAIAFIPALQGPAHAQAAGMIAMFAMYGSYFAVRALTKPIYGIALTLFYFDQRIRKEGFDIEWLMQQAGMTMAAAISPNPEATSSIPGQEEVERIPAEAEPAVRSDIAPAAVPMEETQG